MPFLTVFKWVLPLPAGFFIASKKLARLFFFPKKLMLRHRADILTGWVRFIYNMANNLFKNMLLNSCIPHLIDNIFVAHQKQNP